MASILKVDQIKNTSSSGDIDIPTGYKIKGVDTGSIVAPGQIIQVKSVSGSTSAEISSGTYTDVPGSSVSITPTSTSSKILIIGSIAAETRGSGTDRGIRLRMVRGSTALQTSTYNLYMSSNNNQRISMVTMHYLDSPATTSATTYKFQFNTTGSSATARVNQYASSNVTVMEVAQ